MILCEVKLRRSKLRTNEILNKIHDKLQVSDGLNKTPLAVLQNLPKRVSKRRVTPFNFKFEDISPADSMIEKNKIIEVKNGFRTIIVKRKKPKKKISKIIPVKRYHIQTLNGLNLQLLNKRIKNPLFKSKYP